MKLWTPDKPKLTDPLCPRCRRLRPEYLRRNRRRMGMSLHRACCCTRGLGPCDELSLQVTLAGFDGTPPACDQCYGGFSSSRTHDSLSVDGTYLLSTLVSNTSTICEVLFTEPNYQEDYKYTDWEAGSDCTVEIADQIAYDNLQIRAALEKDAEGNLTTRVFQASVYFDQNPNTVGNNVAIFEYFQSSSDDFRLGDAIPNQANCSANDASDVGTLTVEMA